MGYASNNLECKLADSMLGQEELREQAAYDESYPPGAQHSPYSPITAPPNAQSAPEMGYAPGQYYPNSNNFAPPPAPGYTPQPAAYGQEQYPPPPGAQPQAAAEYGYPPPPTGYTPPPGAGQHPYSPPPGAADPYGQPPGGRARRADENVSLAPIRPPPSRAAERYTPVVAEGGSYPPTHP